MPIHEATAPRPNHLDLSSAPSVVSLQDTHHSWTDDLPPCHLAGVGFSTNQIYREDGQRREEHQFEDRSFNTRLNTETAFYGVFDGHNGAKAANFALQRLPAEILLGQLDNKEKDEEIREVLHQAFVAVENGFFEAIDNLLAEKATIHLQIQDLTSYEAYKKYPQLINRLQVLNREVSSGSTAAVALIHKNKLYVANVGDSRALLCHRDEHQFLKVTQLSCDHNVQNEDELLRLSQLGLDVQKIRQFSNLGNTRCIGNYMVKGGYKDFDVLSEAEDEPVIAEPYICGGIPIDENTMFLLLMSDGLYKSLEEATNTKQVNLDLVEMVVEQFAVQSTLMGVAQAVVDKVVRIHHDGFMSATESARTYHKRDDMTLLVRNFHHPFPNMISSPNIAYEPPIVPMNRMIITSKPGSEPPSESSTMANDPSTATGAESQSCETSSADSRAELFRSNQDRSLPLDEDGRIEPYVDFSEYYAAIEEEQKTQEAGPAAAAAAIS